MEDPPPLVDDNTPAKTMMQPPRLVGRADPRQEATSGKRRGRGRGRRKVWGRERRSGVKGEGMRGGECGGRGGGGGVGGVCGMGRRRGEGTGEKESVGVKGRRRGKEAKE